MAQRDHALEAHAGRLNAFRGTVSGRSTELSRPGCAATTYGTAFTTRIAVATMAPAPEVMPSIPARRQSRSVAATVQSMSGWPVITTPVGEVALALWPLRGDVSRETGYVFDDDRLTPVDHAYRLHAQRTAGAGLDCAHRDLQGPIRHRAIEGLPHFLDLDTQSVGDQADLALPLAGDRARDADPRLEVERLAETHPR